jgi:hypothetical protein
MRTGGRLILPVLGVLAALSLAPRAAVAQEDFDSRRELVLGGPSAVGVHFPISARWSLRVDGSVAGTVSGVGNGAGVGPSSNWNYVVGASALRWVPGSGDFRTYLLGRLGYQRSMPDESAATESFSYSLGFGASLRVHDRAAVFSELSAVFSYSGAASGAYVTAWSSVNRVGVVVRRARRE